ncbi:MAG: tRNA (adenosine(37)-N6)-threonylcarbamoyltransferase complex dimerization subunit type 1 TsaB [Verrucomicrobiota bacterium]|nr:tRNA (adenosine(37)-N6)-threonylcarbamoyltransferase complex dimerization subunit type 1 TsaB [Verrucomicrobiota bacterium]
MKILALEFSSQQRSVAVTDECEPLAHVSTDNHKARPMVLIHEALTKAKIERSEINLFAVGIGPGSYTGIRSSIAIAQGWQLGRGTELCAISSAEVLAATAQANNHRGETHFLIDAQRREYYHCMWELTEDKQTEKTQLSIINASKAAQLKALGPNASGLPHCEFLYPNANVLASLATEQSNYIKGSEIEPIYLRQTEFTKAPPLRQL